MTPPVPPREVHVDISAFPLEQSAEQVLENAGAGVQGSDACGPVRTGSGVVLDVSDLQLRAERGQQSLAALSADNSGGTRGTPLRLRTQSSLPKPPRPILKTSAVPGSSRTSMDSTAAPAKVWRGGSLPSAAIELSLRGALDDAVPANEPPSISRLMHAASWDAGTALADTQDAAQAQPSHALPPNAANVPAEPHSGTPAQDEGMRSSLLDGSPAAGAASEGVRKPLARQVSFSPAVGAAIAEDAAQLWPMPGLRRSLSRALSWGKDRMNSGWSSYSNVEFCRICHTVGPEEPVVDIGCDCRDGLNLAHQSCIMQWFSSRGSNICEICKSEAINIPAPPPLPARPTRPRSVIVSTPPPPASRTAVVGRFWQLLMWTAVGAMLVASLLVILLSGRRKRSSRH